MHPTKHKMYIILSITRKGMLILGLTDVRDCKQINTKVSEIERNRGYGVQVTKTCPVWGYKVFLMSGHPVM